MYNHQTARVLNSGTLVPHDDEILNLKYLVHSLILLYVHLCEWSGLCFKLFRYMKYLEDRSEFAHDKVTLVGLMKEDVEDASCQVNVVVQKYYQICNNFL